MPRPFDKDHLAPERYVYKARLIGGPHDGTESYIYSLEEKPPFEIMFIPGDLHLSQEDMERNLEGHGSMFNRGMPYHRYACSYELDDKENIVLYIYDRKATVE